MVTSLRAQTNASCEQDFTVLGCPVKTRSAIVHKSTSQTALGHRVASILLSMVRFW